MTYRKLPHLSHLAVTHGNSEGLISMYIPTLPVIKMLSLSKEPGTIELRIMWV